MNKQIRITKKDCIGQLKGYPVQIAQRMVECQVEQGNKADVTIFQKNIWVNKSDEGFDWEWTKEGLNFWHNVLNLKIFDIFFDKYPLKETSIKMLHMRLTAKLAKQYGFEKDKLFGTYNKSITKDLFFEFDPSLKHLILQGESVYNGETFRLIIPCYLDRINAIYFAMTGKNLELIKK